MGVSQGWLAREGWPLMSPELKALAAESGKLMTVGGHALSGARFVTLVLRFEAGILKLACNDDTDEIVATVVGSDDGVQLVESGALADLAGLSLDYAWELRNHRGYIDGFQIRLRDAAGSEETVQFEVAASAIDVRWLVE